MIDLDPKTGDSPCFYFYIVRPGPTNCYIPSNLVKETPPTIEREKRSYIEALTTQKNQGIIQKVSLRV